jgi:hypothetical protein
MFVLSDGSRRSRLAVAVAVKKVVVVAVRGVVVVAVAVETAGTVAVLPVKARVLPSPRV